MVKYSLLLAGWYDGERIDEWTSSKFHICFWSSRCPSNAASFTAAGMLV